MQKGGEGGGVGVVEMGGPLFAFGLGLEGAVGVDDGGEDVPMGGAPEVGWWGELVFLLVVVVVVMGVGCGGGGNGGGGSG